MKNNENNCLYKRTKKLKIQINHVAEVGFWRPITLNVLRFIYDGCKADLVEPAPMTIKDILTFFPNILMLLFIHMPYSITKDNWLYFAKGLQLLQLNYIQARL